MLAFIAEELEKLGVPYEFMRWTSPVEYPYVVGEYSEAMPIDEDGFKGSTVILTGFTRNSWLELEQIRAKIENHFPAAGGLRGQTDNGAVVVFYGNSFPIDTGEADLKKIQINLDIRTWKGM